MRVAVALALGLLVVLAGVAVALSAERPRLAGTNNVFDSFPNVTVGPGQEACAAAEIVPGGSAAVRVHAEGGGPLALRLVRDGRELARGSLAGRWADGEIDVPIRPVVGSTLGGVDLCFANAGTEPLTLWGYGAADERRTVVEGEPIGERIRLSYLRAGEESGWDVVGAVAERMGRVRGSLLEGWAFYGWLIALGGVLAVVVAVTLRELRR